MPTIVFILIMVAVSVVRMLLTNSAKKPPQGPGNAQRGPGGFVPPQQRQRQGAAFPYSFEPGAPAMQSDFYAPSLVQPLAQPTVTPLQPSLEQFAQVQPLAGPTVTPLQPSLEQFAQGQPVQTEIMSIRQARRPRLAVKQAVTRPRVAGRDLITSQAILNRRVPFSKVR